jgi:hypothetical protein
MEREMFDLQGYTRKQMLIGVLIALALIVMGLTIDAVRSTANAASISTDLIGKWCEVSSKGDGWIYFQRTNKCGAVNRTLLLQPNGDYVLRFEPGSGGIERCRAARSHLKGWTDYVCSYDGGRPQKRFQKFLIDVETGELMLAYN